jgi:hypothetical protein
VLLQLGLGGDICVPRMLNRSRISNRLHFGIE